MGYRFRLHVKDLPGTPDIVLPKRRKIIFVHGCFWHGHKGCARSQRPTSNIAFWRKKLDGNLARDRANLRKLRRDGCSVLVVWQCWTKKPEKLAARLQKFLKAR